MSTEPDGERTDAKHKASQVFGIPYFKPAIQPDGKLDEACYRQIAPMSNFFVAGNPAQDVPATKAWLFWSGERLMFAFACEESTAADAKPSDNERDVDGQDRVEVFIWSGEKDDPYYCIEISSSGAVHDYQARFYRKFNDDWAPTGKWKHGVVKTRRGYTVEAVLPKASLEAMGQKLTVNRRFRLGLFRADFDRLNGKPTWITWVDHGGKPDFHVDGAFGRARLIRSE